MQSPMGRGATAATATGCAARGPPPPGLTLMRSTPASMRSCSTSFRAWATLLVADIVCHRLRPRVQSCGGSRQREAEAGRPSRSPRPPRPAAALPRPGTGHVVRAPTSGAGGLLSPSSPKSPPVASRGSSPSGDPRRVRERSGGSRETQLRTRWEKVTGVFPDRGPLRGLGGSSRTLGVLRASLALPPSMQGAPRPEDCAVPGHGPVSAGWPVTPGRYPWLRPGQMAWESHTVAPGPVAPPLGPHVRVLSCSSQGTSCPSQALLSTELTMVGARVRLPPCPPGRPHRGGLGFRTLPVGGRAGARSAGPIPCSEGCWVGTAPGRG